MSCGCCGWRMRVLHVVPSLAPEHGGPTEAAIGMVRALRDAGADARIVSSDDDRGGRRAVPLNSWAEHDGVPTFFLPRVVSRQHTLAGFTFAPAFVPWLRREVACYDFVHVHTVFSFPANAAMVVARRRGKPYAVRPLGQLCDWSLGRRSAVKQLQLAVIGRRNLNGAAFLHATSEMEARETLRLGLRCPIKILPLGVTPPAHVPDARQILRAQLQIPAENAVALFLSRIHPKKRLDLVLQALSACAVTAISLVVCGDGEPAYVQSLRQLSEELGLATRVHWLGFVEGDPKWQLLQGADFFVLPSSSENFGIAVAEAIAAGLFVIVSPDVGISSALSVSEVGRVVEANELALTAALESVARTANFDEAARAIRRSFAREQFSWESAARGLLSAYEEALAKRPATATSC